LFRQPTDPEELERLRKQVLDGAYKLVDRSTETGYGTGYNIVNVFATGAIIPEAINASNLLLEEGVFANVVNVTGPGPLYRRFQESTRMKVRGSGTQEPFLYEIMSVGERSAPIVTVVDGAPQALAWIGAAMKTTTLPLGVTSFGQSGSPIDLYKEYEIDAESIMAACFGALDI
jgi:pyruvate dehydrogenase E1 component